MALGWPKHKLGITYLFYFCELRKLPRRYFAWSWVGCLVFEFNGWKER